MFIASNVPSAAWSSSDASVPRASATRRRTLVEGIFLPVSISGRTSRFGGARGRGHVGRGSEPRAHKAHAAAAVEGPGAGAEHRPAPGGVTEVEGSASLSVRSIDAPRRGYGGACVFGGSLIRRTEPWPISIDTGTAKAG
jgi:hypothetical protein